ncbi:hypothetical protein LY76DRAFT_66992 [Colletotrichum caudatum]|nr:hypothetical protein LY76DRAFT_66992 [Colletotrichum caudatum]
MLPLKKDRLQTPDSAVRASHTKLRPTPRRHTPLVTSAGRERQTTGFSKTARRFSFSFNPRTTAKERHCPPFVHLFIFYFYFFALSSIDNRHLCLPLFSFCF